VTTVERPQSATYINFASARHLNSLPMPLPMDRQISCASSRCRRRPFRKQLGLLARSQASISVVLFYTLAAVIMTTRNALRSASVAAFTRHPATGNFAARGVHHFSAPTTVFSSVAGHGEKRSLFPGVAAGDGSREKKVLDFSSFSAVRPWHPKEVFKPKSQRLGSAAVQERVENVDIIKEAEKDVAWSRVVVSEGICVGITLRSDDQDEDLGNNKRRRISTFSQDVMENSKHWVRQVLHPEEIAYASTIESDVTRNTFFLGRLAMREALNQSSTPPILGKLSKEYIPLVLQSPTRNLSVDGVAPRAILKDKHGRPGLPSGFLGSITHKQSTGMALVAEKNPENPRMSIGVDIERCDGGSPRIAKRILTPREREELGQLQVSQIGQLF
jgi:phosphopantetheinyl transferase (holo-ACP synthase)